MRIASVFIKGFRNFKDARINLGESSLVLGANDVGKTNFLFALRIILDRSMSEVDLEPKESDFYAHNDNNEFSILVKFEDVKEDCVVSALKGNISDDGDLFIKYMAVRDSETGIIDYRFYASHKDGEYEELKGRTYIRVLNLKYISSNRELDRFIKIEKKKLIQESKDDRDENQELADAGILTDIGVHLSRVDSAISDLSFIKNSTKEINEELEELSFKNSGQEVVFDAGTSDVVNFINNIQLASRVNGNNVGIGGDGRNNQIFLALWAARNRVKEENPAEVTIYAIEEPEAHLHPHQQRKLAEYLSSRLKNQIIITTHSPQIASEFSPNSIVRLFESNNETLAANDGCAEIIEQEFINFGHRLNIIPAEAFFSDVVLLVEGYSEVLFYKSLSDKINIDLDKLNISILSVDGVGFATYIKLLQALNIDWVVRTDNDIFKMQGQEAYRFAGVKRAIDLYREFCDSDSSLDKIISDNEPLISNFQSETPPIENKEAADKIIECLREVDLFIATKDLENDILTSPAEEEFKDFLGERDSSTAVGLMKKKKATNMYYFLLQKSGSLDKLGNHNLSLPLEACKKIIENKNGKENSENNGGTGEDY